MDMTTTKIGRETLKNLRTLEIHPRETNDDIIRRIIEEVKKNDE